MLTACSLDGWTYFIPTLPLQRPPRPGTGHDEEGRGAPATAAEPLPLALCRFHYPARIAAFTSGLYSLRGGRPTPALVMVTFQNELVIFPDALTLTLAAAGAGAAAGQAEFEHEWVWKPASGANPGAEESPLAAGTPSISGSTARAEGTETSPATAADAASPGSDASFATAPPVYTLTAQSRRRTILGCWDAQDRAQEALQRGSSETEADALSSPSSGNGASSVSSSTLSTLLEWTSSAVPAPSASIVCSEADAAPYVRDLRSADLSVLSAYRALLRRRLGLLDDHDLEGGAAGPTDDMQQRGHSRDASVDEGEGTDGQAHSTPDKRHGSGSAAPSSPSPAGSHLLHSSPLLTPFAQALPQLRSPARASPLARRHAAVAASAVPASDVKADGAASDPPQQGTLFVRSHTDPTQQQRGADGAAAPEPHSDGGSNDFWRKLLRRTQ
jgi:hypothetical protein